MNDSLGDRMKANYEDRYRFTLPRRTNVIIRVDGKAFHTYTRNCIKPFDYTLMRNMDQTAYALCTQIQGAKLAYVQSDEISILLSDYDSLETQAWFDNNIQKMCSISASIATAAFNVQRGEGARTQAHFDARVFTIPEVDEVCNYFLWRSQDATRNSVQMLARSIFGHVDLQHKSTVELKLMVASVEKPWEGVPVGARHGRFVVYESSEKDWVVNDVPNVNFAFWNSLIPPILTPEPL